MWWREAQRDSKAGVWDARGLGGARRVECGLLLPSEVLGRALQQDEVADVRVVQRLQHGIHRLRAIGSPLGLCGGEDEGRRREVPPTYSSTPSDPAATQRLRTKGDKARSVTKRPKRLGRIVR